MSGATQRLCRRPGPSYRTSCPCILQIGTRICNASSMDSPLVLYKLGSNNFSRELLPKCAAMLAAIQILEIQYE